MDDTMNFNGFATDDVEYEVGFDDKDAITRVSEFVISRYPAKKGVDFKTTNTLIEFFDKRCGITWTVTCNPVKD